MAETLLADSKIQFLDFPAFCVFRNEGGLGGDERARERS